MDNRRIIQMVLIYGVIILVAGYFIPKEIDWSLSFSKDHSKPFGCQVLYEEMDELIQPKEVKINVQSLFQSKDSLHGDGNLMILIDEKITMDSLDTHIFLEFIEKGNSAIMAAYQFPQGIEDTMNINVGTEYLINDILQEGFNARKLDHGFYSLHVQADTNFQIEVDGTYRYFEDKDSTTTSQALGWVASIEKPNYIYFKYGKGTILLHSNPYLFTNYNILTGQGSEYLASLFRFLPRGGVIVWDEYYKTINSQAGGKPLQVLLAQQPLRWALYIALAGVLLVLLFMSKRRQRIIPEIDTFRNDSRELVQTIGDLYFNSSDNRSILDKKITLLRQELLRKYKINDLYPDSSAMEIYVQKTGMEEGELRAIFAGINGVTDQVNVSDHSLISINNKINKLLFK